MTKYLEGKTTLITGGASGIGAAIARMFAALGADVVIADLNEDLMRKVAAESKNISWVLLDVTNRDRLCAVVPGIGPIDIFIACAGVMNKAPLEKITPEDWQSMIDVNTAGILWCTQAVVEGMKERGYGRVIGISSITALEGMVDHMAYSATKGAVNAMMRALAKEIVRTGVTANVVCPRYVDTPMLRTGIKKAVAAAAAAGVEVSFDTILAMAIEANSGGQLITPEQIGKIALFLCDPDMVVINGAEFIVE